MELVFSWIEANWLQALQGVGIVGGLCFTGYSFRQNVRAHRAQTLISITQQHRTLWLKVFDVPKLRQVLSPNPPKRPNPSFEERLFVNLLILHITSTLVAVRKRVLDMPAGMDEDMKVLFALPIPKKVWEDTRKFRDEETVQYIESLISPSGKRKGRRSRKISN
jgi:hypothetical protein